MKKVLICLFCCILIASSCLALVVNNDKVSYYNMYESCNNFEEIKDVKAQDQKAKEYMDSMYKCGDFFVTDYKDGVCINQYVGKDKKVDIPENINGKKVLKIGMYPGANQTASFEYMDTYGHFIRYNAFEYTEVEWVCIPSGVKEIAQGTFDGLHTNIKGVSVKKNNPFYASFMGMLFSKEYHKIVFCYPLKDK